MTNTRFASDRQRGFTVIELLAVIAIIAALAGLFAPTLLTAKKKSKQTVCLSNLHQFGVATELYLGDYDQKYPLFVNAIDRKNPGLRLGLPQGDDPNKYATPSECFAGYVKEANIYRCPSDLGAEVGSISSYPFFYSANGGTSYLFAELFDGQTPDGWKDPGKSAWACDAGPAWHSLTYNLYDTGTWHVMTLHYDWHVNLEHRWAPTVLE